jgi:hypothetical protein
LNISFRLFLCGVSFKALSCPILLLIDMKTYPRSSFSEVFFRVWRADVLIFALALKNALKDYSVDKETIRAHMRAMAFGYLSEMSAPGRLGVAHS